jgi:hypothetical protein
VCDYFPTQLDKQVNDLGYIFVPDLFIISTVKISITVKMSLKYIVNLADKREKGKVVPVLN